MPRNLGLDMFKGLAMGLVVLNHAVLWPMRDGDLVSAFAYGIAFGGAGVFAALAAGAGILGESPLSLLGGTFWAILPIFVSGLWYGMRCARAEAAGAPYWARAMAAAGSLAAQRGRSRLWARRRSACTCCIR